MRVVVLIIFTSTMLVAQPRPTRNLVDSALFDHSGQRKQSPYAESYMLEKPHESIWGVSNPHIWFLSQEGDSVSYHEISSHLPSPINAYLKLSIDWDGTIWKAQLFSRDTTNFYRVDFTDIAKRAHAIPGMLKGVPLAFPVMVPFRNQ